MMRFRSVILSAFATLLLALLMTAGGCGGGKKDANDQSAGGEGSAGGGAGGSNVAEVLSVARRPDKVANFTWHDSTGKNVDFDSFHRRVTLINFWATWCGPCKRELPDLVALSRELASRDIRILGVATDRTPNAVELVRSFVKEHGIPYQNIVSSEELEDAFGNPRAIPTSFLVDPNGMVAQTIVGIRSKDFYRQAMIALAGQTTPAR